MKNANRLDLLIIFTGVFAFAVHLILLFLPGQRTATSLTLNDVFDIVGGASTVAALVWAARSFPSSTKESKGWRLIAIAQALWLLGDLIWAIFEIILRINPYPSIADMFYLLYYPWVIGGILLITNQMPQKKIHPKMALDMLMIMFSTLVCYWALIFTPLVRLDGNSSPLTYLFSFTYPLMDLFLLWAVLFAIIRNRNTPHKRPLYPLFLGMLIMTLTDTFFSSQALQGIYPYSNFLKLGWSLSTLFVTQAGLAAVYYQQRSSKAQKTIPTPSVNTPDQPSAAPITWQIYIPFFIVILVCVILLLQPNLSAVLNTRLLNIAIGIILLLIILRQVLNLEENRKLYLTVQKELQNRVQVQIELVREHRLLETRVAERTAKLTEVNRALHASEERYRLLIQSSPDAIIVTDIDLHIDFVNQKALEMLKADSTDQLLDKCAIHLAILEDRERIMELLPQIIASGRIDMQECSVLCFDGSILYVEFHATVMEDEAGSQVGIIIVCHDIALRHDLEVRTQKLLQTIQQQAMLDPLTNIYNRRYFFEAGDKEMEQARRYAHTLSAMMMDIDYFKSINDQYGHQVGDQVLIQFVERVQKTLRQSDLFARYGGDEFIILLPETDMIGAQQLAQRIGNELADAPIVTTPSPFHITASIGIAVTSPSCQDLEGLVHLADEALYQAKKSGRNRIDTGSLRL